MGVVTPSGRASRRRKDPLSRPCFATVWSTNLLPYLPQQLALSSFPSLPPFGPGVSRHLAAFPFLFPLVPTSQREPAFAAFRALAQFPLPSMRWCRNQFHGERSWLGNRLRPSSAAREALGERWRASFFSELPFPVQGSCWTAPHRVLHRKGLNSRYPIALPTQLGPHRTRWRARLPFWPNDALGVFFFFFFFLFFFRALPLSSVMSVTPHTSKGFYLFVFPPARGFGSFFPWTVS